MKSILFTILCSLFTLLIGCSQSGISGLVPAQGTVSFDGKPLDGVTVVFTPIEGANGKYAAAVSENGGHFVLATFDTPGVPPSKGALPGKHKVTLYKDEVIPKISPEEEQQYLSEGKTVPEPDIVHHIPVKYNDAKTSGIEIEIDAKGNKTISIEAKK